MAVAQIQVRRGTTAEWAAASPVVLAAGELGYDITLKHTKIGDGTTEWASLEWIDYGTNPNILHNWDFRNPVNQRGVSGSYGVGVTGYFYDRWLKYYTGTITFNNGSISLSTIYTEFEQRIEGNLLAGKQVTISVNIGGTIYFGTGTFPTSDTEVYIGLTGAGITAVVGYKSGYMPVRMVMTVSEINDIRGFKLELGTVSTLAYDPPMDYGTELVKCRRFAKMLNNYIAPAINILDGSMSFMVHGDVHMRINPSLASGTLTVYTQAEVEQAGFTYECYALDGNIRIRAAKASHGMTNAFLYASPAVVLSSDL